MLYPKADMRVKTTERTLPYYHGYFTTVNCLWRMTPRERTQMQMENMAYRPARYRRRKILLSELLWRAEHRRRILGFFDIT